jgi:hypothetical protein
VFGCFWLCLVAFGYSQLHEGEKIGAKTVQFWCNFAKHPAHPKFLDQITYKLGRGCGGATPADKEFQCPKFHQNHCRNTEETLQFDPKSSKACQ